MIEVVPYQPDHLSHVCSLVNTHVSAVVPGWALPAEVIVQGMQRNPGEYIIDPWVAERKTLCVLDNGHVIGVAHLLRYGTEEPVGEHYRHAGDISWFLVWPREDEAANALLDACHQQMAAWSVKTIFVWNNSLPVTMIADIPDVWPHIRTWFAAAGYQPSRKEARFGGRLDGIPLPDAPPVEGLVCQRGLRSDHGMAFSALLDGKEIGWCECVPDLTEGGALPALRGWAELSEMFVEEHWRNRRIGRWLVQHAAEWLRLGGCDRIILAVDADDEARGAGRFYQQMGWDMLVRLEMGWRKQS